MRSGDIRNEFFDYFIEKGHTKVPSSPLIPVRDTTILFTNAGMVQFKNIFLGRDKRDYLRAVSIQKCMRAGGKHNDLENVGVTNRHHTFFEMLGNFSFGNYFKEGAIEMGWQFLTERMNLPPEKLWITVFRDDDEAYRIWNEKIGIPPERIVRMGEKDNFWQMGDIGPCGPCSEVLIDQGIEEGCSRPECAVGCDCDRFLELWNLVFMQFNRDDNGRITPLPDPSIDTGMGLERITTVSEGLKSNYDTDLFIPLISAVSDMVVPENGEDPEKAVSIRVISDHIRAIAFLIADGVFPANEGRGYVLRRIIRRGAWHGNLLNLREPFLFKLTNAVVDRMKEIYPELKEARDMISKITNGEEERFSETMKNGLKLLEEVIGELKEKKSNIISGSTVFKLYDTYGLPFDLISEIAADKRLILDHNGFSEEMDMQRKRSGSIKQKTQNKKHKTKNTKQEIEPTLFVGYTEVESQAEVISLINSNGESVDGICAGEDCDIILDSTPFYGEGGGQVGDKGIISNNNTIVEIRDTVKSPDKTYLHKGKVMRGTLRKGERYTLSVDKDIRSDTARNHTATHILHSVLRKVLGRHVRQSGSLVASDRLRFDFTHFSPIDDRELDRIEELVNSEIRRNYPVITEEMDFESARTKGATALFEEEYGEVVRVVNISNLSMELCGGTHCNRTGDIGIFKITHEESVASGIRRIEGVTGDKAYKHIKREEKTLNEIAAMLKSCRDEIISRIDKILIYLKEKDKEIERLKSRLALSEIDKIISEARSIKGIKVISHGIDSFDMKELRSFTDIIKNKLGSGIITVGSKKDDKVSLVTVVTKDINDRFHAGEIIKEISAIVGGSGGGRPDMAQAGGRDISRLGDALEKVYEIVERGIQ
ncbi:MAG: alanine--tRNA ligase [Nitrospirota bacterium]